MTMLIRALKTWKLLTEGTFKKKEKKVWLIAINRELTHDNHVINRN